MRRRNGAKASHEEDKISGGDKGTNDLNSNDKTDSNGRQLHRWISVLRIGIHVASVLFCISGFVVAKTKLQHHEECDMTWSHRRFFEIKSLSHPQYRLLKFTDDRDTRHAGLRRKGATDWCLNKGNFSVVPVVFIPGHSGNYQQARSIGAHGLGLVGQRMSQDQVRIALQSGSIKMDVYAVDFREEWTAFHHSFRLRQVDFVRQVISHISAKCGFTDIVLVGHSMGGLVAVESASKEVTAIVTLASPHARPWLYTLGSGMSRLLQPTHRPPVVSIAGGLRDEMIPPEACIVDHGLNLLAPGIMKPADDTPDKPLPFLGMDHKAVVWCRNLLDPVKIILLNLYSTRRIDDAQQRLQATKQLLPEQVGSADNLFVQQHLRLFDAFGFLYSTLLECGFQYRLEWLVHNFIASMAWYVITAEPSLSMIPPLIGSVLVPSLASHILNPPSIPLSVLIVYGLVANSAAVILRIVCDRTRRLPPIVPFALGTVSVVVLGACVWHAVVPALAALAFFGTVFTFLSLSFRSSLFAGELSSRCSSVAAFYVGTAVLSQARPFIASFSHGGVFTVNEVALTFLANAVYLCLSMIICSKQSSSLSGMLQIVSACCIYLFASAFTTDTATFPSLVLLATMLTIV